MMQTNPGDNQAKNKDKFPNRIINQLHSEVVGTPSLEVFKRLSRRMDSNSVILFSTFGLVLPLSKEKSYEINNAQ